MLQDLRFAIRGLRLNPGFTALAALTLALGLGACLAIFSILNGVLLRPLPYPHPELVVSLWEVGAKGTENPVAFPNFTDWRAQNRAFDAMAAYSGGETPVLVGRQAVRAQAFTATEDFFRVLAVEPALGRTFRPDDVRGAAVAVVSHAFWRDALGSPRELAGRTITVDEEVCEVVGVMPPDFAYPASAEVWVANTVRQEWGSRTAHNAEVIARLRPDVPIAAAQQELHGIATRLKQAYTDNDAVSARLIDLRETLVTGTRTPLYLLMGAVLLVLLTACANLASMLLARAATREREMGIRAALGASRGRLIRQQLAESLVLALIGGAGGLLVAHVLLPTLLRLAPPSLPRLDQIRIDGGIALAAVALALLTALLVGTAPALRATHFAHPQFAHPRGWRAALRARAPLGPRATRRSQGDLRSVLADSSRGSTGHRSARARATLVGAEIAVAFVLLVSAGLLIRSLASVINEPLGFNPSQVLTMDAPLPGTTYRGDEREPQVVAFHDRLIEAARALPGVRSVGMTTSLPLARAANGKFAIVDGVEPFGDAIYRVVDAGLFTTLQVPLIAGRLFDASDRTGDGVHAAIINKTLADKFFPGQNALGKRIRPLGMDKYGPIWLTVVGVVGDTKARSLTRSAYPEIFVFYRQRPARARYATLVVRTAGEPEAQTASLRALVASLEPGVPPKFQTFEARIAATSEVADRTFLMRVLSAFSALALGLTAVGIYGVLAYAVARRTQEIGIRMALGATRRAVIGLVVRHAIVSVAAGLTVGLIGAWLVTGALRSVLFGVRPTDSLVLAGAGMVIALTTLLAGSVPAWRATRVDPQVAMRVE